MRALDSANGTEKPTDWQAVNWRQVNRRVHNLRERIFRASQEGDDRKVRNLQKLMLRSRANTLSSVRRATQDNAGKGTAGVDKVLVKTPKARGKLVDDLQSNTQPWRAKPVKRVYIPKSKGTLRPLGIPTVYDRCLQARVKNALEPEWEAKFEACSYGFRPGRGCHDAILDIWSVASKGNKTWVLDADIQGAFDTIDHDFLLEAVGTFPARELVRQWLKAGFMEHGVKHDTFAGTPQGGIVSPLLANIALHGMEAALGIKRATSPSIKDQRGSRNDYALIRYADDFVVLTDTKAKAEAAKAHLTPWLAKRGLTFSQEKTRVVNVDEGIDFLGFTVRRFPSIRKKRGHVLLTRPSKEAVARLQSRLREKWLKLRGHNAASVVKALNPIIRGWANYFRIGASSETFHDLDRFMFRRECRFINRTHPNKPRKWTKERYFGKLNSGRPNDNWVFGDKDSDVFLWKFRWVKIERHVKVKGRASPDDPTLRNYWQRRRKTVNSLLSTNRSLARDQDGRCPVCGDSLFNGETLHRHHMILNPDNPERHRLKYQRLVHLYCHQQVHRRGGNIPRHARELIRDA